MHVKMDDADHGVDQSGRMPLIRIGLVHYLLCYDVDIYIMPDRY
jgi:hypothetical protein